MRRVFNGLARGVLIVSVVLALGSSAEARPSSRDSRWERERTPIFVKLLKRFATICFGDGLIDPKP